VESIPAYRGVEVFALEGQPRALELDDEGLHHPRSARSAARIFTPYRDFTHLASSQRTLWLGTRRSAYVLPRSAFVDPNGPENLVRALLARIARSPEGAGQLARMAQVEETSRDHGPLRAVWGLAALCVLVFLLQLEAPGLVYGVSYYSPLLVLDGDLWRLVTANLVHAFPTFPLHLALNLLALLVLGFLVERPLGTARTLCVMGAAALGSMTVSGFIERQPVVGASGVVFGLAGSALWLELRCADQLPAFWRLPRRLFYVLLGVNAALPLALFLARSVLLARGFFVGIAWGAHLGGFLAGALTTALLAGGRLPRRGRATLVPRVLAAAVLATVVLAGASAARVLLTTDDFIARHAARQARLPGVSPLELNNMAWMIAIAQDRTPAQLSAALRLAERAVTETGRENPHVLDTLAEVQFLLGWREQALATIDEAIRMAPDEPYYQAQRRRFLEDEPASAPPPGQGVSTSPSSATITRPAKAWPTRRVTWMS
jgi:membrane associated rhomboid family serine protease